MEYIKNFKELNKKDAAIAGGKGASLGEMTKAGIPVPPGFVVLAPAFDLFIKETALEEKIENFLNKVNYHNVASVELASKKIQGIILATPFPKSLSIEILGHFKKLKAKFVAVRSSATAEDSSEASWAGELDTYLNTTEKILFNNVKRCWASLFTPRAIVYRNEKGMRDLHVSVAVVIQKMVQSEVSGISFTVHPVTKDKNQMIVEACWGLGELIVGGMVTPDSYIIGKKNKELIDIAVSEQSHMLIKGLSGNKKVPVPQAKKHRQKLSGKQIQEIGKICSMIEKHYKFPCDIEWAMEKGKFYIVQSRPITTL
jgi:pyruvate,water dikinase